MNPSRALRNKAHLHNKAVSLDEAQSVSHGIRGPDAWALKSDQQTLVIRIKSAGFEGTEARWDIVMSDDPNATNTFDPLRMLRVRPAPFRGVGRLKRMIVKMLQLDGSRYAQVRNWAERCCNICGYHGEFRYGGLYCIIPDYGCPECGSLPRHRLLREYFDGTDWVKTSACILHFAPEQAVRRFVEPVAFSYVTADFIRTGVDHNWNIEAIDCTDNAFDIIICSHVLEHVDAILALNELHRILRPGGMALLMIPICEGLDETYENPNVRDDLGRWKHFQQTDHIRIFGRDFRSMVRNAGFELTEHVAQGPHAPEIGLTLGERIFIARKPNAPADGTHD